MSGSNRVTVDAVALRDWVTAVFVAAGVPQDGAELVAHGLMDAEMSGVPSHGVMLIPMYLDRLAQGSVSRTARPEVVRESGAVTLLDAQHCLGHVSADVAVGHAIDKARAAGVGVVAVRNAFHYGAGATHVRRATDAGMIGIAAANTRPLMPAPGGQTPVVGNNPLTIGVPLAGAPPIMLDMALSEVAIGWIRLAADEGTAIPDHWATDADGRPTTDPRQALAGMLLPAGGPKGFGLALMLDLLTGALSGGGVGTQVKGLYADLAVPNNCSHLFIVLDVDAFAGASTFDDMAVRLHDEVTGSRVLDGHEPARVPGARSLARHRTAEQEGITLDPRALDELRAHAVGLGLTVPALPTTAS